MANIGNDVLKIIGRMLYYDNDYKSLGALACSSKQFDRIFGGFNAAILSTRVRLRVYLGKDRDISYCHVCMYCGKETDGCGLNLCRFEKPKGFKFVERDTGYYYVVCDPQKCTEYHKIVERRGPERYKRRREFLQWKTKALKEQERMRPSGIRGL
jgi:hypothetical protein